MLTKQQYIRLTIVLSLPLLMFGLWLAENETIISSHHIIYCEELESHISCVSVSAKKSEENRQLYQNGAVRLWRARLVNGFHHPIVTLGHSELKIVDGKTQELPPADGGVEKTLHLPPNANSNNPFSSCGIDPFSGSKQNWGYSCIGSELIPGSFRFLSEKTNHKFQDAITSIKMQINENEKMEMRAFFASLLAPLACYLLFSATVFFIIRIAKYVIHGRRNNPA